jgi:hypothetical protein
LKLLVQFLLLLVVATAVVAAVLLFVAVGAITSGPLVQ